MLLLGKARVDQLYQSVHGLLLIRAIGNDADGNAANDAQAQHAQKAFGIDPALFLLDPNGRLELIGLLNKERSRTSVKDNLILDLYFFSTHANSLSSQISQKGFCCRKKHVKRTQRI